MNKLDKQYQELLGTILDYGVEKSDRTGTGTKSIFGYTIRHNMADGFPLLTTKKMFFKGIKTELLWFLKGDTHLRYLLENKCNIWNGDAFKRYTTLCSENSSEWNKWMRDNGDGTLSMYSEEEFVEKVKTDEEFSDMWGSLGPVYGYQWRKWTKIGIKRTKDGIPMGYQLEKVDQIENLIKDLIKNPDSRRLMVTAWNPAELEHMTLPPCHYGFQVYTRELSLDERHQISMDRIGHSGVANRDNISWHETYNKTGIPARAISLMWNQRSVDTFLGLPFNIASYGLLLTIIAKMVNMVPDQLIGNLGDTHLYMDHLDQARLQMTREPRELPKLVHVKDDQFYKGLAGSLFPKTDRADFMDQLEVDDFKLEGYDPHPEIKANLSN